MGIGFTFAANYPHKATKSFSHVRSSHNTPDLHTPIAMLRFFDSCPKNAALGVAQRVGALASGSQPHWCLVLQCAVPWQNDIRAVVAGI